MKNHKSVKFRTSFQTVFKGTEAGIPKSQNYKNQWKHEKAKLSTIKSYRVKLLKTYPHAINTHANYKYTIKQIT